MEKGDLKISKNTVVHCPTKELAQKVLNVAGNLGYKWRYTGGYDLGGRWDINKEDTCLNLRVISFGERQYFEEKGFKVISAEDFLKLHEAPKGVEQSVLLEADLILNGNRQADYGDAVSNFGHIAKVVNTALRRDDITPDICCMVHIATKLCREGNKHKRDNLVDLAAYSDILNQIKERG